MTRLRVFTETDPTRATTETRDGALIAELLARHGVRFERWNTPVQLTLGASQDEVIAAYRSDIDRLMAAGGYRAVDVVSLSPDHPDRAALREKFLNEHCHAEDEVRFFVAGAGLFTLHLDDMVFEVLCEQGDLIGVPDNTRHWFDMGPNPFFIAIRLFTNASGWVANFTGTDIALQFPRLEN